MDIIEEYIVKRGDGWTESYKQEVRDKFEKENYMIVDFVERHLDSEGKQVIQQILSEFVDNYIEEQYEYCVQCKLHGRIHESRFKYKEEARAYFDELIQQDIYSEVSILKDGVVRELYEDDQGDEKWKRWTSKFSESSSSND
jgi:ribosomal protein S26